MGKKHEKKKRKRKTEFGMRRDVLTYSLAGMGCSSSLVCVDAAMHMLRGLPKGSRVLIVNHENITANW